VAWLGAPATAASRCRVKLLQASGQDQARPRSGTRLRREPAGQRPYLLTELLTKLIGTGETARHADDAQRADQQVSETRRDGRDAEDGRRTAHNPATNGAQTYLALPASSPWPLSPASARMSLTSVSPREHLVCCPIRIGLRSDFGGAACQPAVSEYRAPVRQPSVGARREITRPDQQQGARRLVPAVPQPGRRRITPGPAHQHQPPGLHERTQLPAQQTPRACRPHGEHDRQLK
jgi:hypothetical protein